MMQRPEAALGEMQRYLQDEIPSAEAAGAVAVLMAHPPEVLMQHVGNWAVQQARQSSVLMCDLLLHAMQKVYVMGEVGLLDREAVANYLDRVTTLALRICPPEEKDQLRNNLAVMRMSRTTTATRTPVSIAPIHLPALASTPAGPPPEDEETAKRFSLIVDRLQRQMEKGGPQSAPADPRTFAQLLTMAASRSQSGEQFSDYLKMIQPLAGGKEGNVFVILGGAVPTWDIAALSPGHGGPAPAEVGAMEKIIDLAEDGTAAMSRFRELVIAAVHKFNDDALGATLWMLDVAETTIEERKLDLAVVDRIRSEAADAISSVQLRKYTENRGKHQALRIALGFFPTLRLDALFRALRGEARADRRRSLLGFIEAYGVAGRDAAIPELEQELARSDVDTYYLRNLIYLLHRIARDPGADTERELAALAKASARGQNIYVVKEALTALGSIRSDAAVKILTTWLSELEALLLAGDTKLYPIAEMQKALERTTVALSRIGTSAALLAIARHGMLANPLLGDTRARLSVLASHDLSFDEETVRMLVKALRAEIPGTLFGRLPPRQDSTVRLIEALSGTRSEAVNELLREIASRFPTDDVGRAAAAVVGKLAPPAVEARTEAAATLTGELEFFGLPSVMQTLGDMRATGMLTLTTKQRQVASKLIFSEGKFLNARTGNARGVEALYEALERPVAGTFAFVPHPPEKMKTAVEPLAIMPLLLEGVRRHDELQRLIVLVPDDMCLRKGTVKPTPPEDEDDPALVRDVWLKALTGVPVAECEVAVACDAFRVRRLLGHWLQSGALVAV